MRRNNNKAQPAMKTYSVFRLYENKKRDIPKERIEEKYKKQQQQQPPANRNCNNIKIKSHSCAQKQSQNTKTPNHPFRFVEDRREEKTTNKKRAKNETIHKYIDTRFGSHITHVI